MIKIKNNTSLDRYDYPIDSKYRVKLDKLKEGEKISIFSDAMFKTMFQNEKRLDYSALLASYFIEDVSYEELLNNLVLVKNEFDKNVAGQKGLRGDYVASIGDVKLNIEINNNYSREVMERNLEYAFRLYSSNNKRGKKDEYNQVIQICLNNFAFEDSDKIIETFTIRNEDGKALTNKFTSFQIYVSNLRKKCYTDNIENLNDLERFILILVERSIELSKKLGKGHKIMEKYINDAINASGEDILLEAYDKEWALKDLGRREGYEEGYDFGVTDGINLGIEQGIEQRNVEMVRNMLSENISIDLISKVSGLSIEKIEEIKNKM